MAGFEQEQDTLAGLGPGPRAMAAPAVTPRQDFGSALASLARLYEAAEQRGDREQAERYAAAVQLLLGGQPATDVAALAPDSSR